jgi:pimeloyl-ACP methyl ester carboxylesterase
MRRKPQPQSLPRRLAWLLSFALALAAAYVAGSVLYVYLHERASPQSAAPASGQFFDIEGTRVFARDFGPAAGRPLLLVHGTAAWSGTWFSLVPALRSAGWRVVAVDLPPFGYSDKRIDRDYSRIAQATRLRGVLDGYGVAHAVVLGHSFGGGPALEFALRDPDRVERLVLVDAALGLQAPPPDPSSPACRALAHPWLRETLFAASANNPLWSRKLLQGFVARKDAVTPERLAQYRRPSSLHGANAALAAWGNHFACVAETGMSTNEDAIRGLRAPLALLWGAGDTITPPDQARHLQSLLPASGLQVIPGVGHIPHIEDPARFEAVLVRMLAEPAPAAASLNANPR